MYSKVMGAKGWDFYREISVKWRGQVVGIRRNAVTSGPEYMLDEQNDEEASVTTAELDEGVKAPVQADKPIPAAKAKLERLQKEAKKEASDEKKSETQEPKKPEKEPKKEKKNA